MRSYHIDELDPEHIQLFKDFLQQEDLAGPIEDIYWLIIPRELLTAEQKEHEPECGPYFLSLETGDEWLNLELLVRCRGRMRCSCIQYATEDQRVYAMNLLDTMLKNRDIPV
ncbi:MAG: hypothetical protein ACLFQR_06165 [Desulfovibrionales bacterium]